MPPSKVELWRTSFSSEAYTDQTGQVQRGSVVHEQVIVYNVRKVADKPDPYSNDPLPVYSGTDAHNREFRGHTNWDSGAVRWVRVLDPGESRDRGVWSTATKFGGQVCQGRRHVYEDGRPVEFLLEENKP